MNEQALMQILLDHLTVTEKLLDYHIRLDRDYAQQFPTFSPHSDTSNMLSTIRLPLAKRCVILVSSAFALRYRRKLRVAAHREMWDTKIDACRKIRACDSSRASTIPTRPVVVRVGLTTSATRPGALVAAIS
jgi:hypothetical protein